MIIDLKTLKDLKTFILKFEKKQKKKKKKSIFTKQLYLHQYTIGQFAG